MTDLKARGCNAENCGELAAWISQQSTFSITEEVLVRTHSDYDFRMRHRRDIVEYARIRYSELSTRDIAKELLEKFGVKVSNVTIHNWVR